MGSSLPPPPPQLSLHPPFPLGITPSTLGKSLSEEQALASLCRAASPAAWRAADSFTAFTANGIQSLLSYQCGFLASCRKGHVLGAQRWMEPESFCVPGWPAQASVFSEIPLCSYLWLTAFFFCLLFHWALSSAFHSLTKNLCCPSYFCQFQWEQVGHLSLGTGNALYTLLRHIGGTALYLEPGGPFSRAFHVTLGGTLCVHFFFHDSVCYWEHFCLGGFHRNQKKQIMVDIAISWSKEFASFFVLFVLKYVHIYLLWLLNYPQLSWPRSEKL